MNPDKSSAEPHAAGRSAGEAPPAGALFILKKREDFLASRGGQTAPSPSFLLALSPQPNGLGHARVGFTVTRKLGNAVARNRIRRRLREAAARVFPEFAASGRDYVVIARSAARTRAFALLLDDMKRALLRLSRDAT